MAQYKGPQVDRKTTHEQLLELFAMLVKDIQFILNGHLDANNIKANSIETKNLKADSVTAEKISVGELSAISANLGHITAGLIEAVTIIGSLIKTADSGQRVELSSTENLLKAVNGAGGTVSIKPFAAGIPSMEIDNGTNVGSIFMGPGNLTISTSASSTGITIASGRQILLSPGGGYSVQVPSWNSLYNNSTGKTLQQELNEIWAAIGALSTPPPTP